MTTLEPDCQSFDDDLAALALGALMGRERSEVLDHVATCARCSGELERLSVATDALIATFPEVDAPAGFAERTLAAFAPPSAPIATISPIRRPPRWVAVAAAAVVLGFGVLIGHLVTSSSPPADHAGFLSAALSGPQGANGEVIVAPGSPSWLIMTVADVPRSGWVRCEVTLANGHRDVLGHFTITNGYGSWASKLSAPLSSVRSVSVIDAAGQPVESARL